MVMHDSLDSGLSSLKSAIDQCDRLIVENHVPFSPPAREARTNTPQSHIDRLVDTSAEQQQRHVTTRIDGRDEDSDRDDSSDQESLSNSSWMSVPPADIPLANHHASSNGDHMTSLLGSHQAEQKNARNFTTHISVPESGIDAESVMADSFRAGVSKWLKGTLTHSSSSAYQGENQHTVDIDHSSDDYCREFRVEGANETLTWASDDLPLKLEEDDTRASLDIEGTDDIEATDDVEPVVEDESFDIDNNCNPVDACNAHEGENDPHQAPVGTTREKLSRSVKAQTITMLFILTVSLVVVAMGTQMRAAEQAEHVPTLTVIPNLDWVNATFSPIVHDEPAKRTTSPMLTRTWSAVCGALWLAGLALKTLFRKPTSLKRERFVREPSPLLEMNATAIEQGRRLLECGTQAYRFGQMSVAEEKFRQVTRLACSAADKTAAFEWLGRCLYRQARYEEAKIAFARVLSRSRTAVPTARASLGRVEYRLGRFKEAIRHLRGALKRDYTLEYAHEFLGKALVATGALQDGEKHLEQGGCRAFGFLGDRLHLVGQLSKAQEALKRAISLRHDYPGAHARLALVYTEQLDKESAALHWRHVIATCDTGLHDKDLSEGTRLLLLGPTPHLALIAALRDKVERVQVSEQARRKYSSDLLVRVVSLVLKPDALELKKIDAHLKRRIARRVQDDEASVLRAIVELGLGGSAQTPSIELTANELAWPRHMLQVLKGAAL
ncbi:hypothetical protein OIV83_006478 [Microbotryomycetes sp. JL201]|nr:hypothetical protein OIV83_006478 [Microbotryomycetes sp. JL201]